MLFPQLFFQLYRLSVKISYPKRRYMPIYLMYLDNFIVLTIENLKYIFLRSLPFTQLKQHYNYSRHTAQNMKFPIKDFFSKCNQIRSLLRIWSHLLKKFLIENFVFCAVAKVYLGSCQTSMMVPF